MYSFDLAGLLVQRSRGPRTGTLYPATSSTLVAFVCFASGALQVANRPEYQGPSVQLIYSSNLLAVVLGYGCNNLEDGSDIKYL